MIAPLLALVLVVAGSLALYLTSRHQLILGLALRPAAALPVAGLCLVLACVMLSHCVSVTGACFDVLTGAMLLWSLAPIAIALLHHLRKIS